MKIQYEPTFEISESQITGLGDRKIGEKVKIVIDYVAIEKTKSYLVLKANSGYLETSKRKF